MKKSWLAFAAVVLAMGSARAAPFEPTDWLDRMLRAGQDQHYTGVYVYSRGNVASAMRLVHVGLPAGPLDRVQALDGMYWELRRNPVGANLLVPERAPAGEVVCPLGGNFSTEIPRRLQAARGLYRLVESGKGRVAGRVVQQIDATPGDPYRYGLRLAVDEETGLLLKVSMLGSNGLPTEQAFFTFLEVVDDAGAQARGKAVATAAVPDGLHSYPLDLPPTPAGWQARWLPPGFALRSYGVREGASGPVLEHLLFSDGLATVSVFVEDGVGSGDALVGSAQSGTVGAYGAVLGGRNITVMGRVPDLTLRMLSENLARTGAIKPVSATP